MIQNSPNQHLLGGGREGEGLWEGNNKRVEARERNIIWSQVHVP